LTPAPTPSQTVGPFFSIGLCNRSANDLVEDGPIAIEGSVLDGAGDPVPDAMVEIWQADAGGSYSGAFGWGRSGTDDEGRYSFRTVKPGAVDGQAPHLVVLVFARGLLKPVLTRMYFADEAEANAADPVLAALAPADAATLVAEADGDRLRFDVRLQGERQTAFFEL
jgi:protocatechuate 3,4-dioxygenase, alpha subunit